MDRNEENHQLETPVYQDRTYTIWLPEPTPRFRVNPRLSKIQREALLASNGVKPKGLPQPGLSKSEVKLFTAEEIRKINQMSSESCQEYIEILRTEQRIPKAGEQEKVRESLKEGLVELRNGGLIADDITVNGLKSVFDQLQSLSHRIIVMVDQLDFTNVAENCPKMEDSRELALLWIRLLVDQMVDMTPAETASLRSGFSDKGPDRKDLDFYTLMCEGLVEHMDASFIEDVYFPDGTVAELFRRTPEETPDV